MCSSSRKIFSMLDVYDHAPKIRGSGGYHPLPTRFLFGSISQSWFHELGIGQTRFSARVNSSNWSNSDFAGLLTGLPRNAEAFRQDIIQRPDAER
jgi:hypothetical protein